MRKVIYGGATSLDLYLARDNGAVDWLIHDREAMEIMKEMWPRFDAMVMRGFRRRPSAETVP